MNTEVDMKLTLILSLILMAALLLMLYAAVALVQSKKLFGLNQSQRIYRRQ